jgi:hypothetical protein
MRRLLAVLALYLTAPAVALAWGDLGHRVIGELAERRLSPETRAQVRALLAGEPEPTLASAATWPDAAREQPEYSWSAPLHYVRIHDAACRYDAARDCARGACIVAAIPRYARTLADRDLSREQRAEALKFLTHFVGDVHQPLHSGHRPDKGGNEFQISLRLPGKRPQATHLHAIWDHFLPTRSGETPIEFATRLEAQMPAPLAATVDLDTEPVRWAEASCALSASDGFYPPRPGTLPPDYLDRMRPLVDARLQLAAARLAQLLEDLLGGTP